MLVGEIPKERRHVKFISYTGKYPNLCGGILTLEINGKKITFGDDGDYECFWESGGGIDWLTDTAFTGEWEIDIEKLPKQYKKYAREIDKIFNANVEHGCCGGCI